MGTTPTSTLPVHYTHNDWKAYETMFDFPNFQLRKLKSLGWFGDSPISDKGTSQKDMVIATKLKLSGSHVQNKMPVIQKPL